MKMDNAENRTPDDGYEPESDGGWFFDLPSGAWERQEQKNRQLRQSVRDNIDDPEPESRTDPFRQKRGLFGFGRRDDDAEEPGREIAGGKWTLNRGGGAMDASEDEESPAAAALFSADEADEAQCDSAEWAPELPEAALETPEPVAPVESEPERETEERDFSENPILAAMSSWARATEPERETEAAEAVSLEREADNEPEPQDVSENPILAAMSSWARPTESEPQVPDTTFEANTEEAGEDVADETSSEPAAPAPLPLRIRALNSDDDAEEESAGAEEDESASRWNQMFGAKAEEAGGLSAMRDWAHGELDTGAPLPVDEEGKPIVPEDFLKPFDWEEGDTLAVSEPLNAAAEPTEADSLEAHPDEDAAESAHVMPLNWDPDDEQPAVAEEPMDGPEEPVSAELAGDDWSTITGLEAETPWASLEEAPEQPTQPEKKGFFSRLFGRKKKQEELTEASADALPQEDDSDIRVMARGIFDGLETSADDERIAAVAAAAGWVPVEEPETADAVADDVGADSEASAEDVAVAAADTEALLRDDVVAEGDEVAADSAIADAFAVADTDGAVAAAAIGDEQEIASEEAAFAASDSESLLDDDVVSEPDEVAAEFASDDEDEAVALPESEAEVAADVTLEADKEDLAFEDNSFAASDAESLLDDDVVSEREEVVAEFESDEAEPESAGEAPLFVTGPFALQTDEHAEPVLQPEDAVTEFAAEANEERDEVEAESSVEEDWEVALASVFGGYDDEDPVETPQASSDVVPVESTVEMANEWEPRWPADEHPGSTEREDSEAEELTPAFDAGTEEAADAPSPDVTPDEAELAPSFEADRETSNEPLPWPRAQTEHAPPEDPEEELPDNVVPLQPARAEEDEDPWAAFIAARRASGESFPKDNVPADSNPAGWDEVFSGTQEPVAPVNDVRSSDGEERSNADQWGHLYGRLGADASAPPAAASNGLTHDDNESSNGDDDDPWADVAAASGYGGEPSDVAVFREPTHIGDRRNAPRAPEPQPSAPAWAGDEDADDVVLRAFYEHANSAADDEAELDDQPGDLQDLLGEHASELIGEAGEHVDGSFNRMQGWVPQRGAAPEPEARGWQPHDETEEGAAWPPSGNDEPPVIGYADDDFTGHTATRVSGGGRAKPIVREVVETVLLAALVFLCVRASFQNFKVDGTSMYPTLDDGQFLIVNKLVYSEVDTGKLSKFVPFVDPGSDPKKHVFHGPERGDIIVMVNPSNTSEDLIKRVIGLPGETIEIRAGQVYINDLLLEEPYIKEPWNYTMPKQLITEGNYFVMGDNRANSWDSRFAQVGLIPEDYIIGKAMFSYWPTSHFGLAPNEKPSLGEQKPRLTTQRIDNAPVAP